MFVPQCVILDDTYYAETTGADRDETGSHQKKLTNPTPEGFRGLFIDVCGMFVGCLLHVCGWHVCGWHVA